MTNKALSMKAMALKAVGRSVSDAEDNLYRANLQFSRLSETQLAQNYGVSCYTCSEIWDQYKEELEELKACQRWLESIESTEEHF